MKVLVAGDFCPQYRVAELFEKGDFASVFGEVKSIIEKVDYSIVNLECPVATGSSKSIDKIGPNLRCSNHGVEALKWVGFNCVTLANNHFFDYGEEGVRETLNALDALDMDHVGGGINIDDAARILYKIVDGRKLAIINCCEHEFSIATETTAGSAPLNPMKQFYSIQMARREADYVLVIVHGGHEHFQLPSPRMVEVYRFFVDAGADAVVNHHQHCYSGYEIYRGKPIFYGLGNFCFDKPTYNSGFWTEGYVVTLEFNRNETRFTIHPFRQCAVNPSIELIPAEIICKRIDKLNVIINNPVALSLEIENYYSSCAKHYASVFEPIHNRCFLYANQRGWLPSLISKTRRLQATDYICCESHRDKLIWFLKKMK